LPCPLPLSPLPLPPPPPTTTTLLPRKALRAQQTELTKAEAGATSTRPRPPRRSCARGDAERRPQEARGASRSQRSSACSTALTSVRVLPSLALRSLSLCVPLSLSLPLVVVQADPPNAY
jgi:hypothetical protein